MDKLLWPIYEFRPIIGKGGMLRNIFRYNDNHWIPDDGQYDLAFACYDSYPSALYVSLPYRKNILWSWVTNDWQDYEKRHPGGNAWHYMLRSGEKDWGGDWHRDRHPNTIAGKNGTDWICHRCGCANGSLVEFNLKDEYILAGLVRERDTKKILTVPENPICMYGCNFELNVTTV